MISIRREISLEGVMAFPSWEETVALCRRRRADPSGTNRNRAISTGWPHRAGMLMAPHERPIIVRNRAGAVFGRAGFHHLPRLGAAALCLRRNARLRLWPASLDRARMP